MTIDFPESKKEGFNQLEGANLSLIELTKESRNNVGILLEKNQIRRNNALNEINEVLRPTEVMAVGDLHGNINALYGNLSSLGVVSNNFEWIGGDTQLVFLGDIIGDRHTGGFDILTKINELNYQAKTKGGAIHIIAGNHDNMVISFLLGRNLAGWCTYVDYGVKAKGIEELIEFVNEDEKEKQLKHLEKIFRSTNSSYKPPNKLDRKQILANMKNSEKGRELLDIICNMKVVEQIDDILFAHTDIMPEMIELILKYGVDKINEIFQDGLKKVLIEGYDVQKLDEFGEILDVFLNTDNRYLYLADSYISGNPFANVTIEQIKEKLKKYLEDLKQKGVNVILHGHSNLGDFSITEGGIIIKSLDRFAYKKADSDEVKSTGIVRKDGNIQYGENKKSLNGFRDVEY